MRERRAGTAVAGAVTQILGDGSLQQIQFQLLGERVSGVDFFQAACQVEAGVVTVRPIGAGALDGTVADYRFSVNVMDVPDQLRQTADKAAVVHEAVHVVADLAGRSTDAVTHEAAAFVAGAWYYQLKTGSTETGPRAAAAHQIVTAFRNGQSPSHDEIQALLDEVQQTYSGHYSFDGIAGGAMCIRSPRRSRRR